MGNKKINNNSLKQKKSGNTVPRSSSNKRLANFGEVMKQSKFGAGGLPFDISGNLGIGYIAPNLG